MDELTLTHSIDNNTLEITVSGRLAIDTAANLLTLFKEQLASAKRVTLHMDEVTEIDLVGIQLICSACRSASQADKRLNFSGALPGAMKSAISEIGLQRYTTCKHNTDMPCIWYQGA